MKKENRSLSHLLLFTDACVKRKAELSTEKSCGKRPREDQSSTNGMFLVEFLDTHALLHEGRHLIRIMSFEERAIQCD